MINQYPILISINKTVLSAIQVIEKSLLNNSYCKIITAGNGASASSDAENIVVKLMKSFNLKRALSENQVKQIKVLYPEESEQIRKNLQNAIPAISLNNNDALLTACINNLNPEFIYAQQIFGIGNQGDVFIGISTSGNSKNIINAAKIAIVKGLKVIGLTGRNDGNLKQYCDICIQVPAYDATEIQKLHLVVCNYICAMLEYDFFSDEKQKYNNQLIKRLPQNIELIVFDFDGVFTDNKVYTSQDGTELVSCDRRDGLGINFLQSNNYNMFILSTETNPVVSARAKKMDLDVVSGCKNKALFLQDFFAKKSINPQNVIYIGNDLNDMDAMKSVGFSVAPNDAHPLIKEMASLVLTSEGGNGAVREFCEYLLKHEEKNEYFCNCRNRNQS